MLGFCPKTSKTTVVLLEELAGRRPVRVQNSSVVAQGYTVVKEP